MTKTVLEIIADSVKKRLEFRMANESYEALKARASVSRVPHLFYEAFDGQNPQVIAEVKFRSPALGNLSKGDTHEAIKVAQNYFNSGAAAISVLTEVDHFQGDYEYLKAIREALPEAHLLMKDFMISEYQILEARCLGADAILLIVALLGEARMKELYDFAVSQKMNVLVEVHDEVELEIALRNQMPLIGINNRNLKTLEVTLETSRRLMGQINDQIKLQGKLTAKFISESGIDTPEQVGELFQLGYSGFLIGSALMKSGAPSTTLSAFLGRENQKK